MPSPLIAKFAERFGVDAARVLDILKATAFRQKADATPISDPQMTALLVVADQYGLNPFTREIYAYPDRQNGIVPVVGIDGWSRIINQHPAFDGLAFQHAEEFTTLDDAKPCPVWMECVMYRKDRQHPIAVREYLDEVYRLPFVGEKNGRRYTVPGPWQTHTKRCLRHKTLIQAARLAFGFVGIYDQDEAERILEAQAETPAATTVTSTPAPVTPSPATVTPTRMTLSALPSETAVRVTPQIVARAQEANAWQAALDYAASRFKGADLDFATAEIERAWAAATVTRESTPTPTPERAVAA